MPHLVLRVALCLASFGVPLSTAGAQEETPPPELPAYSPPVDGDGPGCFPACRAGYLCHRGACISECNPPCSQGEVCRPGGSCVSPQEGRRSPSPPFPPPEPEIEPPPPSDDEVTLRFELGHRERRSPRGGIAARLWWPRAHEHDGFMLRLTLGLGGAEQSHREPVRETLSGLAGMFSVDAGASIAPNLVLHGRLATATITDADLTVAGEERGTLDGFTVDAVLLGPAVTYYIMPANVYVTGALGLGWLSFDDQLYDEGWSTTGLALNLDLGKEWWIQSEWGLGVAGRLFCVWAHNDLADESTSERFTGLAILLTATYQ